MLFVHAAGGSIAFSGVVEIGLYQVFSGFDAGDVTGLKMARPQWWGAVVGDTGTDNAAPIMKALEAVALQYGIVLMSPGTYYTATEITPVSEYYYMTWKGEGEAEIKWNGAVDATKSVFRATVTPTTDFAFNTIENINFQANSKAGFGFVIEGNVGANGNAAMNVFNTCRFFYGTVAGVVIGENAEPAVNDSACSMNTFNKCYFESSPYNVKINSINAYETTFNGCEFNDAGGAGTVIQDARILYGGMTRFNDCQFGRKGNYIAGHPHGASDNVYSIYTESPITLRGVYTEEARLLMTAGMAHSHNDFSTVESIYVNDSRANANLEGMYFINATAGSISVKNASAKSGTTGTRAVKLAAVIGFLENILLGNNGVVILTNPEKSVIDGIMPGGFASLLYPHNWNFQRWTDIAGVDDIPMYWTKRTGTGGVAPFLRSTANNVYGDYTVHVNVTTRSTNWLIGVGGVIDIGPNTRPVTVIVSGKTDGSETSVPQIRLNNVTKATNTIHNADYTFVVTADIDSTAVATTEQYLDIGIKEVGQYWIDTVVVVPGIHPRGLATAFVSAKNIFDPELVGNIVWNPGSLVDGAGETSASITVTGAALGDFVMIAAPYDAQDLTITGYVQAANTVEIRIQNESGGTIDLASGTWKVKVLK